VTRRLYFDDMYCKEFAAVVQQRKVIGDKAAVCLDQSLFYPTSGGQMHDKGWLNDIPVLDVQVVEEEIWHILDRPLPDDQVSGKLDWVRRFDFMQQHTAFHILAGSFHQILQIDTLASHLGEVVSTIEINKAELSPSEWSRVEEYANQVVFENRTVRAFFVENTELSKLPLRKQATISGAVRLVEIADIDLDPCGGTHVSTTGQVGLIKLLSREKVRGHLRLSFVAGARAWREMSRLQDIATQAAGRFTTSIEALGSAIDKMQIENRDLRKKNQTMSRVLAEAALQELIQAARASGVLSYKFSHLSAEDLRWLASSAVKQQPATYLLAGEAQQASLVFSSSDQRIDLRQVIKKILPLINGKGGGDAGFVQGAGTNLENLDKALQEAKAETERQLKLAESSS
jgi:alanyl-tRNA synthetase